MGCFDSVMVPCPKCGEFSEFQSKGGDCLQRCFVLGKEEIPADVLSDVNRHVYRDGPFACRQCGTKFAVNVDLLLVIKLVLDFKPVAAAVEYPCSEAIDPPATIEDALALAEWPLDANRRKIQCSTCTFWQPGMASRPGLGVCVRSYLSEGQTSVQITIHGAFDQEGRLETKPEFGCLDYYPSDNENESSTQTTPR
jgi:hypothetical protein